MDTTATSPAGDDEGEVPAGTAIGRFVVVRRLGEGGMGAVFEARDPELSRPVAIKVLRDRGGDALRLLREAQALARLSHPNVVTVYELGSHGGQVFVAMELVDGVTLDRHLDGVTDWRAILAAFVPAGRGLAAVHAQGLVHRDVKPSNVLVDRDGRVRVSDFGLARHDGGAVESVRDASLASTVDDGGAARDESPAAAGLLGSPITVTGAAVGTPRYMAPEQHAGLRVTRAADQFGFCVALWEALYGEHPFGDGKALVAAVVAGRRRAAPAGRGVPAWLERTVARGLASDPAARWPSMEALLDQLEGTPRRRRRIAAGLAVVALAGAAATGGLLIARRGGAPAIACADAASAAARTWTPAARAALASGFATGRGATSGWATAEAGRVDHALGAWIDRWRDARIDACRATFERGEQSAAMLDKRAACLDQQLAEADALATALAHPDRAAIEHARDAVVALPTPEGCTAARLADAAAPPTDPRAAAVARVIADARARLALRGPQAPVLADQALTAARALGDPTLLARALIVHADAVGPTDVTRKRADLAEAIAEAGASRDPMIEIDAITDALDDDDKSGRDALMPVLRAAVKRGGDTRELRRSLAVAELRVELLAGHWKEAHAACDRALALSSDPHQIAHLQEQCSCQIALQERAGPAAVTGCRAAYEAARRDGGDDSPTAASLLSRLGSALERVGKPQEAEAAYRDAVTRLEALYGPDSELVVAALADWGLVQSEEQHNDQARATLARAVDILDRTHRTGGRLYYGVLSTLAGIDADLGRADDSVREINLAVVEGEKFLGPDHPDLATLIANQAQVLAPIKAQRAAAIAAYQRALAIIQKTQPDNPLVGLIELSYGSLLVDGKDYAAALPIEADAVARLATSGNAAYIAESNRVLGTIEAALRRVADARAHLTAARAAYVEVGAVDDVKAIDKQLGALR